MNALLLCKVWSKTIALARSADIKDSQQLTLDLIDALKFENFSEEELKLAIAYIDRNLNLIEDLLSISNDTFIQLSEYPAKAVGES